jgi:hypothetical protein
VLARPPYVRHRLLDNSRRPRADPLEFDHHDVATRGLAQQIDSAGRAGVMLPADQRQTRFDLIEVAAISSSRCAS